MIELPATPRMVLRPAKPSYLVRRVCAWCGRRSGWRPGGDRPGLTTHSICKDCIRKQDAKVANGGRSSK